MDIDLWPFDIFTQLGTLLIYYYNLRILIKSNKVKLIQ